jgi:hypothetical protein
MKMRGLRNWLMLKGLSFSNPIKILLSKTRLSQIVSPWSRDARGSPTSNMMIPAQDPHTSATPPAQDTQDLELQDSTGKRPSSPPAQELELQDNTELRPPSPPTQDPELQDNMELRPPSPPAQDPELQDTTGKRPPSSLAQDPELQDITGKRLSSPPAQDTGSHPSIEQPELLPSIDRDTPQPLPSAQQPIYVTAKDSLSSEFSISGQKVQNINKNICRQMFQALEPFRKEVVVGEPNKDSTTVVTNFFSCYKKYQHKEPLKDIGVPGMTIEEFWEDGDKDYTLFEYGKSLVTK